MTEVKKELGECFAAVVFKECPDALKENMGLEPKLKGAGANLWTSPSDLLIGKVCLKPPLTDKHIKALTHEGILAIGYDIELKYWNEMELEKQKALLEQEEHLKIIAEKIKRVAVKMARDEEIAECENRFHDLTNEFEQRLKEELDSLEQEMLEYQESVVRDAIQSCQDEWQVKLENAVQSTIDSLNRKFLKDLESQKQGLESRFRTEFERQQGLYENAIAKEEASSKTTMEQLRHCLECKNLANLMYVLCMERRKCGIERSVLEFKQKASVDDLSQIIKEKDEQIRKLTDERNLKQRQLDVREKCLLEILKQFQKFINYALRATPTQAEFLLDVRKMMLFEITQAMVERAKDKAPHLARQILPWKTTSELICSSNEEEVSQLTLPDFHECLDEIIPPAAQSNFVPSFYYNNKMYVSNDLQLMAKKGMEISETNILWNKDVEHVMKLLKASVEENEKKRKEQCDANTVSAVEEEIIEEEQNAQSAKLHLNLSFGKSALKHDSEEKIEIETPIVYCNLSTDKTESRDASDFIKKIIKASIDVELAPLDTTGLLAAKDSLIKIRESRRSSLREMPSYGVEEVETNNMLMAVKESLETELAQNAGKRSVDGSVNFEKLDAIRISDQLEIKRSGKTSKVGR
ncbi:hypothetical protein MML48_5g00017532 [Holotrichia oblita]|uniref:Uncharacterized protein n=1 Tax=Holotrichia oblita TaxID=644536 RepID=A0ACB9T530_HOLOL|nr:hypothetical protein MML48_5g00017532 [Holotrichia oblita]